MKPVITVLSEAVVNQIAAGEVVTRPASVVRELLDNAIDAGATDIHIEIEKGGKKRILVRDNGCGMDADSLKLAVRPHATSKITNIDDLQNIRTLGFRGEALASILSVSRIEMVTCETRERSGHRLAGDGKQCKISPAASPPGTSVTVRDLFWNVPARRKFLRSDSSETRAITETVIEKALASTAVAFHYVRDGQEVFDLPGGHTLKDRVKTLFGSDICNACIPFDRSTPSQRAHGLASDPSIVKSTRSLVYIFVNGRRVQEKGLAHAILTVYREILDEGFPAVFLFIEIDPHLVDVNVHPAKAEVRFSDAPIVNRFVSEILSAAVHRFCPAAPVSAAASARAPAPVASIGDSFEGSVPADPFGPLPAGRDSAPDSPNQEYPASLLPIASSQGRFRILGQIYKTFLLVEETDPAAPNAVPGDFWIVDQHLASERVILSRMTERIESQGPLSQALLVPLVLELGLKDSILFERVAASLRRMGFETEPFGPRGVWIVRAVPTILGRRVADRKLFLKFVEELATFDTTRRAEEELFHDVLAHFSCRSAIKAGDTLLPEEQAQLLSDLLSVEHFRICPHGRPSMIKIPKEELERRFLRK